jgi:hypothetical protein
MSRVDHLALNGRRLRNMKSGLDRLIRAARGAHKRSEIYFHVAMMDGGKMRNLDDLVMHLEDARKEIREYLAPIK